MKVCRKSGGKVAWRTEKEARAQLARVHQRAASAKRRYHKMETDVYPCPHGRHWHLTSQDQQTGKSQGQSGVLKDFPPGYPLTSG